jgi:hypothetical protein
MAAGLVVLCALACRLALQPVIQFHRFLRWQHTTGNRAVFLSIGTDRRVARDDLSGAEAEAEERVLGGQSPQALLRSLDWLLRTCGVQTPAVRLLRIMKSSTSSSKEKQQAAVSLAADHGPLQAVKLLSELPESTRGAEVKKVMQCCQLFLGQHTSDGSDCATTIKHVRLLLYVLSREFRDDFGELFRHPGDARAEFKLLKKLVLAHLQGGSSSVRVNVRLIGTGRTGHVDVGADADIAMVKTEICSRFGLGGNLEPSSLDLFTGTSGKHRWVSQDDNRLLSKCGIVYRGQCLPEVQVHLRLHGGGGGDSDAPVPKRHRVGDTTEEGTAGAQLEVPGGGLQGPGDRVRDCGDELLAGCPDDCIDSEDASVCEVELEMAGDDGDLPSFDDRDDMLLELQEQDVTPEQVMANLRKVVAQLLADDGENREKGQNASLGALTAATQGLTDANSNSPKVDPRLCIPSTDVQRMHDITASISQNITRSPGLYDDAGRAEERRVLSAALELQNLIIEIFPMVVLASYAPLTRKSPLSCEVKQQPNASVRPGEAQRQLEQEFGTGLAQGRVTVAQVSAHLGISLAGAGPCPGAPAASQAESTAPRGCAPSPSPGSGQPCPLWGDLEMGQEDPWSVGSARPGELQEREHQSLGAMMGVEAENDAAALGRRDKEFLRLLAEMNLADLVLLGYGQSQEDVGGPAVARQPKTPLELHFDYVKKMATDHGVNPNHVENHHEEMFRLRHLERSQPFSADGQPVRLDARSGTLFQ